MRACVHAEEKYTNAYAGVYRKLAIVINVLSSCNARFVKHGEQDGSPLTRLVRWHLLARYYSRKTNETRKIIRFRKEIDFLQRYMGKQTTNEETVLFCEIYSVWFMCMIALLVWDRIEVHTLAYFKIIA